MTTIVACKTTLTMVADSAASYGSRLERTTSKLYRYKDFIAGFAGKISSCTRARKWLKEGMVGKRPGGDWVALLLYKNGKITHVSNVDPEIEVAEDYYAVGSGEDFALGALDAMQELGVPVDAAKALKVACRRDKDTALPMHTMRWRTPK